MKVIILFLFMVSIYSPIFSQTLTDDYKKLKLQGGTMVVVPIENCEYDSPGFFDSSLSPGSFCSNYFQTYMRTFVRTLNRFTALDTVMLRQSLSDFSTVSLEEKGGPYAIPMNNAVLTFGDVTADYVLLIENVRFEYRPATSATILAAGKFSGGSFASISQKLKFWLWDNKTSRVVSYGNLEQGKPLPAQKEFKNILFTFANAAAGAIAEKSPFYKD